MRKCSFLCQSYPPPSWTRGSDVAFAGTEFYVVVGEVQKHHGKNADLCNVPECATQPGCSSQQQSGTVRWICLVMKTLFQIVLLAGGRTCMAIVNQSHSRTRQKYGKLNIKIHVSDLKTAPGPG